MYFDTSLKNECNGLWRAFRAPRVTGAVSNNVVDDTISNYAVPAFEAANIKSNIVTKSEAISLDLSNRFVLINGNYDATLPAPSATYAGVEFVVRMISGDTPNLAPASAGQLINSSGTAASIQFTAHGTLRAVCGKDGSGDYKWFQV